MVKQSTKTASWFRHALSIALLILTYFLRDAGSSVSHGSSFGPNNTTRGVGCSLFFHRNKPFNDSRVSSKEHPLPMSFSPAHRIKVLDGHVELLLLPSSSHGVMCSIACETTSCSVAPEYPFTTKLFGLYQRVSQPLFPGSTRRGKTLCFGILSVLLSKESSQSRDEAFRYPVLLPWLL